MPGPKDLKSLASEPIFVPASSSVKEAAQLMQRHFVGSLVVEGPDGDPIGLVTDRDLALGALTRPPGTSAPTVQSLASTPLLTLPADSTVPDATRFLGAHCVRRVGLTDEKGALVAVLSSDVLLMYLGTQIHRLTVTISREFQEEKHPTTPPGSIFGSE